MTENEYSDFCKSIDKYPHENKLEFLTLGLNEEAGEVAGKIKRIWRDDKGELTTERELQILTECGDVLWYLTRIVDELGYEMVDVRDSNVEKLAARVVAGTIHGAGDKR